MEKTSLPNKCDICKKNRLIIFKCKCSGYFCLKHRYTNYLNCTFDYISYEREKIRQDNPVVVQDKIKHRT